MPWLACSPPWGTSGPDSPAASFSLATPPVLSSKQGVHPPMVDNTQVSTIPPEESVVTVIRNAFPMTEYQALRDEIITRLELRQQLFTFVLIVAGTFLSLGFQSITLATACLVYPVIAVFLAASFEQNDEKIGSLSAYLRQIEERYQLEGWETSRLHKRQQRREKVPPLGAGLRCCCLPTLRLFLASALRSLSFSARGLFLTTQVLSLAIGGVRIGQAGQCLIALPLVACGVLATGATFLIIQHKRS